MNFVYNVEQAMLVWHVSRIQKSHPIWMRLKVEVNSTPSMHPVPYIRVGPIYEKFSDQALNWSKVVPWLEKQSEAIIFQLS